MVKDAKLFHIEFGPPEGYGGNVFFTTGEKISRVFVIAETYGQAVIKALRWAESNRTSITDTDGSLVKDDYTYSISRVVLISNQIIE